MERIQQVRFCYDGYRIYAEIVYEVNKVECPEESKKIVGLDISVNNLAVLNDGQGGGLIINALKSINQFYNKKLAKKKSVLKRVNNQETSKATSRLTCKRRKASPLGVVSKFGTICIKQVVKSLIIVSKIVSIR